MKTLREYIELIENASIQEDKNCLNEEIIRSEKIGPYTHELHKTPWGYQVRVYAGGKQIHSSLTKKTEEQGMKSFDANLKSTKEQLRLNEQDIEQVEEGAADDVAHLAREMRK